MAKAPMAVFTRKKSEAIVINDNITVTVVELLEDKVRLGIVAPMEATVLRKEVYDALHRLENQPGLPEV